MFVARMITRSKWEPKQGMQAGEISADAVTGDLKTQENALSFWRCTAGTRSYFEEAALAIAAGRDDVAKVEIVWLDDEDLYADGQTLEETDGRTPVVDLVKSHVDVRQLDYERLGKIARRVVSAIATDQYRLITRVRVRKLLASAVSGGRVNLEDLNEKIQTEIQRSLATDQ